MGITKRTFFSVYGVEDLVGIQIGDHAYYKNTETSYFVTEGDKYRFQSTYPKGVPELFKVLYWSEHGKD